MVQIHQWLPKLIFKGNSTLSNITGIIEEDLISFETDKKVPTEEEKQIIFDLVK